MTVFQEAINYAQSIGAVLTAPEYFTHDQSWVVEAEAPDGKQWTMSESQTLVCIWYHYIKGDKDEELRDLIARMKFGLEDYVEE